MELCSHPSKVFRTIHNTSNWSGVTLDWRSKVGTIVATERQCTPHRMTVVRCVCKSFQLLLYISLEVALERVKKQVLARYSRSIRPLEWTVTS
ncbi:hypothetical protein GCU68_11870 [Natronorubrum aibiense]|uniref:Uncharacterized protein n=1 Tax=Natronorubrum aibiense TaxID=348826 RepID=A0A5P9P4W9_9EURY|nr:hypothetical protein GCU68_11870 [Natronorubrum aibiense]